MEEKKMNYNYLTAIGKMQMDDMEIVEELGLDPAVAYTPKINSAALDRAMELAYEGHIENGMSPKEAKDIVATTKQNTLESIREAEKLAGMKLIK